MFKLPKRGVARRLAFAAPLPTGEIMITRLLSLTRRNSFDLIDGRKGRKEGRNIHRSYKERERPLRKGRPLEFLGLISLPREKEKEEIREIRGGQREEQIENGKRANRKEKRG